MFLVGVLVTAKKLTIRKFFFKITSLLIRCFYSFYLFLIALPILLTLLIFTHFTLRVITIHTSISITFQIPSTRHIKELGTFRKGKYQNFCEIISKSFQKIEFQKASWNGSSNNFQKINTKSFRIHPIVGFLNITELSEKHNVTHIKNSLIWVFYVGRAALTSPCSTCTQ